MPCRSCPSTNWILRNNSDNVSAVLRSKHYTPNSDDEADRKKCCRKSVNAIGGNNCYCHDDKPIRPRLFPTPNSCICVNGDRHYHQTQNANKNKPKTPKIARPCKFLVSTAPEAEEEVKHDRKHKIRSRIRFFERYDSGRVKKAMQDDATSAVKSIARSSSANSERSSISGATRKNLTSRITTNKQPICHKSCNARIRETVEDDYEEKEDLAVPSLKDLREFRDEHFFETHHTTEDLIRDVPEHVCVHRFELDDRELPKAINCDAYGKSRCKICEKPMEHNVALEVKETSERRESFPKFYKYGLAPKNVYMGSGNVRMEVIAEVEDDEQKWEKNKKALRNFQYANTCALRFQKGVV